ncbi:MAG: methyltransferase family protein [Candidatus Hodarchaeota archaeon]
MSLKKINNDSWTIKENILMSIVGLIFFLNLLLPVIISIVPISKELVVVGYILLGIGALFVIISIVTLRRKGVSTLFDRGIYVIVRHPMYLGAIIMFFSHPFIIQHWIIVISSLIAIICMYIIILLEEDRSLEKYGDVYNRYIQTVPRINFFLGIIRRTKK